MKNALTKNLDDPTLEAMPVIPTDMLDTVQEIPERPTQELITQALATRPELAESDIDLQQSRDHAQSRGQCASAHAEAGRLLRQQRIGRQSESVLRRRAQSAGGSHELVRSISGFIQQFVA